MVVCGVSSLGSGSGHRSAVGNGTKDLSRTGSWKDPNPGLLEAGVGPALWGTPDSLLTSGSPVVSQTSFCMLEGPLGHWPGVLGHPPRSTLKSLTVYEKQHNPYF